MRQHKLPQALSAWLYGTLLSGSAISCTATAFDLPLPWQEFWLILALGAGLLALLLSLPYRALTLSLTAAGTLVLGWKLRLTLAGGFAQLVRTVTELYHNAYGVIPLLDWTDILGTAPPTACLTAFGLLLAALTVWTVCRSGSAFFPLLAAAPWLAVCLVVVDELPALWALLLLLGAALLLVLTQNVRLRDSAAGLRLTLLLAVPVAALVVGLALLMPPERYARSDWTDQIQTRFLDHFTAPHDIPDAQTIQRYSPPSVWSAEDYPVDLSLLEARPQSGTAHLEVYAEQSGSLYLRGASLNIYAGNQWNSVKYELPGGFDPLTVSAEPDRVRTVQIRTHGIHSVFYTPYYLTDSPTPPTGDSEYRNTLSRTDYTVSYAPQLRQGFSDEAREQYDLWVAQTCTALPEDTRTALLTLAVEAGLTSLPQDELPQAVARYVSAAAEYSLTPPALPEGADFASWFLTEAGSGYCVHFATATALMLRALGVPARYVTGYLVQAEADAWVTAQSTDAHAWAEYYEPGFGWIPLESTPSYDANPASASVWAPEDELPPGEPDKPHQIPNEPEPSNKPQAQDNPQCSDPTQPNEDSTPDRNARRRLLWLLIPFLLGALASTRPLRRAYRSRLRQRGTANDRALALWQELNRLSRHTRQPLPDGLEALALKARFSQHQLCDEELSQLRGTADALTAQLYANTAPLQRFRAYWLWAE